MYELKIGKVFTSKFLEPGPYVKKNLPSCGLTGVEKHWYSEGLGSVL
jgi:hypothetical protein